MALPIELPMLPVLLGTLPTVNIHAHLPLAGDTRWLIYRKPF